MTPVSENNRRIAKNTLLLYFRTGITLLISLYTSRIVLKALGVDDFGIFNLVAGIVVLFSFLNTVMTSATQRFLNFEMGKNNMEQTSKVFAVSMMVHSMIALTVFVLAESVGLLLLFPRLDIPEARLGAAHWAYQFAIASTLIGILSVPYNATVVAYEKMKFFAYVSLANALFILGIAFVLSLNLGDNLKIYSSLLFACGLVFFIILAAYCRANFDTVRLSPVKDGKLFKDLLSFSGWSLLGGMANTARDQGLNILLNIFFGVATNAAMGIANQVNGAVYTFVRNFQTAFNPQIIKSYSSGDREYFLKLLFQTSKISFFLMLIVSLPIMINTDFVLSLWLGQVPEYSASFIRWTIAFMLVESLSGPLWISMQATGKIRNYQIIVSALTFINLPAAYVLLKFGFNPVWVLASRAALNLAIYFWRIFYMQNKISLPAIPFISETFLVCALVGTISAVPALGAFMAVPGTAGFLLSSAVSLAASASAIWLVGFNKGERIYMINLIRGKKHENIQ